jgi:hypothetical protein
LTDGGQLEQDAKQYPCQESQQVGLAMPPGMRQADYELKVKRNLVKDKVSIRHGCRFKRNTEVVDFRISGETRLRNFTHIV